MQQARTRPDTRAALRIAADRLLAWGFEPAEIAGQLGVSLSWIYAIRRERQQANSDAEENALQGTHREL